MEQGSETIIDTAAGAEGRAHAELEFRQVTTESDWRHIQKLRETIYVTAESRIGEVGDFAGSFDRYNEQSQWFLALSEGRAVGSVRVVGDSEFGLPYESVVGRGKKDPNHIVAEIGHLLSISGPSSRPVVMGLMREAFAYACNVLGATHVVGDVFVDKTRGDAVYRRLGFTPLHGPYRDSRFLNAPMSMIMILEVASVAPRMASAEATLKELLRYLTSGCIDPEIRRAAAAR